MIDPLTAIAVFELIEKSVRVGSEIAALITRAKNGEVIPIEEIKADQVELDGLVDEWDAACKDGE
jgi:hypothetical protein